jgi:hypothetical protein
LYLFKGKHLKRLMRQHGKNLPFPDFVFCDTQLEELQQMASDLKKVDVEEMDTPKECYAQDSRFSNGIGFASEKYPGMIFQEGNVPGYVGKIRLTKEFKGQLPDGTNIDLATMKLRDVFTVYPSLNEKGWGSRGCSGYWHFTMGEVMFFVKIDKSIQPQYPVREADYLDKPVEGIDFVTSCYGLLMPETPIRLFRDGEPMYFLDSIRTNESFLEEVLDKNEVAAVNIFKGEEAIRMGGSDAKNGIVMIFRKEYAREKYWTLFRRESSAYAAAVPLSDDSDVVYIVNGKVLSDGYEGQLFNISKSNLVSIVVIDQQQLKKKYGKKGRVGVVIRTRSRK